MAKKRLKIVAICAVLALLAVLVPQHHAHAGLINWGISQIAQEAGTFILGLVGTAIRWVAQGFDAFVQWQINSNVYGIPAVTNSWTIIRNFVNLFFILVLIIMAFGTIFAINKYTWKEMLMPFLISALLINFSLAIGQYIIDISNGLASVFLKAMVPNNSSPSMSVQLAQGFSQQNVLTATTAGGIVVGSADAVTSIAGSIVFGIIWLTMVLLAFLSAFIFALARFFALWFLLIISPIAWLGYALPNLRASLWSKWWQSFLCWCFFLPYYLFFLMFAVIFINRRGEYQTVGSGLILGSLTFNDFVVYGVSLVFMVMGLAMARKLACASGSGIAMAFGKIETGVRKYAPGAAYVRGAIGGVKERGAEIAEKGVFGIGGAQRGRLQEATAKGWIAATPGMGQVPGAREGVYRAQAAEVDKEVKRLQILNLTLDQLNDKLINAKGVEKIAAFKLKTENGWLEGSDADTFAKMVRDAGGGKTALGASLIQSGVKGGFERMADGIKEKEDVYAKFISADAELAKAFGLNAAQSNAIQDEAILKSLLQLVSTGTEAEKEKAHKQIQKNIENVYRTKADRAAFIGSAITDDWDKELKKMAAEIMVTKGENDVANIETIVNLFGGRDPGGKIKTKEASNLYEKMLETVAKGNVAEMRESFDSQKTLFNGLTDHDLQKAFGRAMTKSRTINDEAILEKVLDLYSSDTEEIQKQVAEEVQKNIENVAKDTQSRRDLVNSTTASDNLRKIASKVLVDKNEVDTWQLRRTVLEMNGGMNLATGDANTIEGVDLVKNIGTGNTALKAEAKYRKDNSIRADTPLASGDYSNLENTVITDIKSGLIRSLSTEELKTPVIFNALVNGRLRGTLSANEYNNAVGLVSPKRAKGAPPAIGTEIKGKPDRKKREAINAITAAAGPVLYP